MKIKVAIDPGHGWDTSGKGSPTALNKVQPYLYFKEFIWNREIANRLSGRLTAMGIENEIIVPEQDDISLKDRASRVNKICIERGSKNVVLVSIHSNAHSTGKEWTNARGWSIYTSPGKTNADLLATYIYQAAEKKFTGTELTLRKDLSDGDPDFEENFYILKNTYCPAILSENFFYTNVEDTKYLLSEEGKEAIVDIHVKGIQDYIKYMGN